MDVTPLIKSDAQVIQSYAGGFFRISGEVYSGPVIVFPSHTTVWHYVKLNKGRSVTSLLGVEGHASGVGMLTLESFEELIERADEIDVVLLGCGAKMQFMDRGLKNALKDKRLSVDVMDTGAACRTYNVLMAEGRRVVAALIPV